MPLLRACLLCKNGLNSSLLVPARFLPFQTEIIEAMGYPTEIHNIVTGDGYILELHRIPHGINSTGGDRPVALLQHCLLCSSADYIMNTPDQALGESGIGMKGKWT